MKHIELTPAEKALTRRALAWRPPVEYRDAGREQAISELMRAEEAMRVRNAIAAAARRSIAVVLLAVAWLTLPIRAEERVYTVSGNFARDLYGPEDTRANCWGHAEASTQVTRFFPPEGKRVRILAVRGDLVAWIGGAKGAVPPPGSAVGVLLGFSTTAPDGSQLCEYCASNTFQYIQAALSAKQPAVRAPYNYTDVDTLLEPDNTLVLKVASWLNNTDSPVHIEATYTIKFQFDAGER